MVKIISLGGSIVVPDMIDNDLIKNFKKTILEYLEANKESKLVIIIGGGAPARIYQKAYREIIKNPENIEQDWIGIYATRLNARLLKAVFSEECLEDVIIDPEKEIDFKGRILIAAGWKPGFSTDHVSVKFAEKFNAKTVINLSNIAKVYTDDPKLNPDAKPIDHINWDGFKKMVGDEWVPGKNLPFDPIATKLASELKIKVITAAGRNIENIKKILNDEDFEGSTIGPE